MEKIGCRRRSRRARAGQPAGNLSPAGAGRAEQGMAAGEVATALGIAPNTLSFHFDRLRHAGLVSVARQGRSLIYAARYETMNNLLGYLTENCCGGKPGTVRARRLRARRSHHGDARRRPCDEAPARPCRRRRSRHGDRLLFHAVRGHAQRGEGGLRQVDAGGSARQFRHIHARRQAPGSNHLGIQVEDESELAEVYGRLDRPAPRCWRKARPPAATPSPKNPGSTIQPAYPGRHF